MKNRSCLFICLAALAILPYGSFGQAFLKAINPEQYSGNFQDMAKQIDMFYDTANGANRSGFKQWKREQWFAMHHLGEDGKLANCIEMNEMAIGQMNKVSESSSRNSTTGDWMNLGHSSVAGDEAKMGRVNSIAFDPVNNAVVYVASAGGGIWKTFNNGDTWTNLTIDLPTLGIADIVVSPAPNNNIVYALTGDIAGSANSYFHHSVGVLKSYNSGASWTRTNFTIPLSQELKGYKLLMHPTNPDILLAAMSNGIHRTVDGGNTWTQVITSDRVNDMEFKPNNPNTLYFTIRNLDSLYILDLTTNVFSITIINTFLPSDRIEIAVTPDNNQAVYLLAGPGYLSGSNNLFNGLFYSGNGGASFSMRSNSCNNNGDLFNSTRSQSWYDNTIYVDPAEENNVIVGGVNLFKSINGGTNLVEVTSTSIHADHHNLKRNPLNGDLWLCNDGGVYRSTDNGSTWNNRSNGLIINEYYRISGTNNATDLVLGGTQDNGHFMVDAAGTFQFVMGGDGMDNYFNTFDNSIAYACTQNGGLNRSINYGETFYPTTLPSAGNVNNFSWITPIVQHPPSLGGPPFFFWENTDVIYVYSLNGVFRCSDGINWVNIGPAGSGEAGVGPSMAICGDVEGTTNLYASNGNSFWACFNPLDNVPTWNLFSLPINSTTYISAMAVNPAVRTEVWVSISGYAAGTKVFRSQNGGLTWSNVSLSLPNIPVYSITFANASNSPSGAVFVGTEIGVFYTDDMIPDWIPFSNQLPHVPVTDLSINYSTSELKAATFGRGIWQSDLYQSCPSLVLVDFDINQGQYSFESSSLINANRFIDGGIGTNVHMKAANQVKLVNGFRAFSDSYVRISIGSCGSGVVNLTGNPSDGTVPLEAVKVKAEKKINE